MSDTTPLRSCPFCQGVPKLTRYRERIGYGEYERNPELCSVNCLICGARGPEIALPAFVDFVPHDIRGVKYWRDNPHKRAEWDEKHEAHIQTLVTESLEKWNRRGKP